MHLAGYKIRRWRDAHSPPLSAEEFGAQYGDPWPSRTIYGWESKGKIARAPVQRKLAGLGICAPEDWLEPCFDQEVPAGKSGSKGWCPDRRILASLLRHAQSRDVARGDQHAKDAHC